jgi:hypothetical protein
MTTTERHARLVGLCALLVSMFLSIPASAQVDFSGEWGPRFYEDQPERAPGPELADYLGLPINDAARLRADSWQGSFLTLPEWECRPHGADYIWRGPSNLTISKEEDPLSREIRTFHLEWLRSIDNPVYLDGRPHPDSEALHSWGGFATGKWEGDMLTVTIDHIKEGYIRRNGLPRSSEATVVEHWIRHGDFLTVVVITTDPVYLTEPFIRTTDYELDLHQHVPPYPCEMVTEIDRPRGVIPHYLFNANPDLEEFGSRHGIPFEATRGGALTAYPDYRKKLKELMGPFPTAKPEPPTATGAEP